MVVLVLTACPPGLRGDVSRWLLEIAPGVFVGRLSARVRARNEQHLAFKVHQPDWQPVDCEGVELIRRPAGSDDATLLGVPTKGWSSASKYRRARKYGGRS